MAEIINIAEEIKERADIADHIGRVVKLRKRGVLWEGLCPFHNEKTPSFKVYDASQHYHCYGCGATGDVIGFYMKYYNLDFIETATRLAEELHIDWKPGGKYEAESRKEEYFAINREAAVYYHGALRAPDNPGYAYLAERGLSAETMTAFGLGYAAGGRDGLSRHLIDKGLSLEKAAEMTLIVSTDDGYRDRYYNRVMFPIINVRGKVVGFSSRALDPNEKAAKYINSSESKIFKKKEHLYALGRTKDAISAAGKTAILVEGQMDVISLWQHGVTNVAGTGGTALTEQQANLLKRYADKVVLAFDMDDAGREAAMKGGDVIRASGLDVRVMSYEGKDPDEFVRAKGQSEFSRIAGTAVPFLEYKLTRILRRYDLESREGPVAFLKAVSAVLAGMSPVERDYYVQWLEEMTGISAAAIEEEASLIRSEGGARSGDRVQPGNGFTQNFSGVASVDEHGSGAYGSGINGSFGREPGVNGFDAYESGAHGAGFHQDGSAPVTYGGTGYGGPGMPAMDMAKRDNICRQLIRLLMHDTGFFADLRGRDRIFTDPALTRIFVAAVDMVGSSPEESDVDTLISMLDPIDVPVLRGIMDEKKIPMEDDARRQLENCLLQIDVSELTVRLSQIAYAQARIIESDEGENSEELKQLSEEKAEILDELMKAQERIRA